ncbi:hypothetical protein NLX62_04715 [Mycobacteriaceae bacterium Msp059]|nr:hypothetical protein [Mycobacteriaceae bacterium Msp059]
MSDYGDLPIHPTTGLRAIGIGKRGPWWPVMGASEDHGGGDNGAAGGEGGGQGDPATGAQAGGDGGGDGGDGEPKPTETVEFWKGKAREWEDRSKANSKAAGKLAEANERADTAEAEVATVPAKVAEALKTHLVARHEIDAEDAELFLTATDPELMLKQINRLLAQSGKSRRKNTNYVPDQGNGNKDTGKDSGIREFTRQLFGNDE